MRITPRMQGWFAVLAACLAVLLAGAAIGLFSRWLLALAAILALIAWLARPRRRLSDPPIPPLDEIQFTVYRPKAIHPGEWYSLLVFAHLADRRPGAPEGEPAPIDLVRAQAGQFLEPEAGKYRDTSVDARRPVPRGGEITLLPVAQGIEFNPGRRTFHWLEDLHREEFRLRTATAAAGTTARGQLMVYLGAILLAEIDLTIRVDSADRKSAEARFFHADTQRPYRKIFASYSHRDAAIVRQYEALVQSCGDRYLRDVRDLRAGEEWNPRLQALIAEADIFQLFWSTNSMCSRFVRMEWEHALKLDRPDFIRPTYWETPLPESPADGLPPETLRRLHFHWVDAALVEPSRTPRRRLSSAQRGALGISLLLAVGLGIISSIEVQVLEAPRQGPGPRAPEVPNVAPEGSVLEADDLPLQVKALVAALQDKEWQVRTRAAKDLAGHKYAAVVEALTRALGDVSGHVRRAAAQSLGQLGDPAAVPALMRRVADDVWEGLGPGIHVPGDDTPYDNIAEGERQGSKPAALATLKKLAPEKVEQALLDATKSENPEVRRWALDRLNELDEVRP